MENHIVSSPVSSPSYSYTPINSNVHLGNHINSSPLLSPSSTSSNSVTIRNNHFKNNIDSREPKISTEIRKSSEVLKDSHTVEASKKISMERHQIPLDTHKKPLLPLPPYSMVQPGIHLPHNSMQPPRVPQGVACPIRQQVPKGDGVVGMLKLNPQEKKDALHIANLAVDVILSVRQDMKSNIKKFLFS